MKVLHVLNSEVYSGAEKVVSQIIKLFADKGGYEMAYCSRECQTVRDMLREQGIPFIAVEELTPASLRRVIREQKPDVIHAHDMRASFVAALCCGRIPLVSHIHNNAYDARGITVKSVGYLLAGLRARHIIWVSQSSYEGYAFHKLFAKKSSVLYNMIDMDMLLDKLHSDPNTYDYDVIYLGRLTEQKNPQRLMRVFAKVRDRKRDVKIAVAGNGELEEQTRHLSEELGLGSTVEFLGFQSNPIKMLSDSRVMVLTSRWEGTPMCALEAMALGVCVVSTPADGMADLIRDGVDGYLSEDDDVLADRIVSILEDDALRQTLAGNARRRFEALNDVENYAKAIEECYRR